MNDGFKQRLVGAIVLGSLALILWPVVFTKTQGPAMDKRSQIPPPPSFEKYTIAEPVRPQNIDPVSVEPEPEPPVKENKQAVTAKSPPITDKPQLDKKGLPESWVLQVASFSKSDNAEELKNALKKKGYRAFTERIKTANGESVRVYVGPKFTKAALTKDKKVIDKAFKVKSMVVRFKQ